MATDQARGLKLQRIERATAARAFGVCRGLDPKGQATPETAAQAGECWMLGSDSGALVYSLAPEAGGRAWIHAAAGIGGGMTETGLRVIEAQARAAGCAAVAFQTVRRGLVRRARRLGYRIAEQTGAGYVLEKVIT